MKFDKYIKIGVLGIALWSLTGCTDWLDVQPVGLPGKSGGRAFHRRERAGH